MPVFQSVRKARRALKVVRHFFYSMKKKRGKIPSAQPLHKMYFLAFGNSITRCFCSLVFGCYIMSCLHAVICVIIYLAGFLITLLLNRPSVRPTVFFSTESCLQSSHDKNLRVQPWLFSLLLLSSSLPFLLLLSFFFVCVIQEHQSGPKSLPFDVFSLK